MYFQVIAVNGYRADYISVRAIHVFRHKCFGLGMWLLVSVWQLVSECSLTAEGMLLMLQANPTQPQIQYICLYIIGLHSEQGVNRESKNKQADVYTHTNTQEVSHTYCQYPVRRCVHVHVCLHIYNPPSFFSYE